ncbi:DUF2235 domain-containing protein [Enterobacter sp. CC120223-11]|uniref:T6SS phospholipase effector Tle1-like catalytic domain-containing protein n=1 Tax=Enterobacter sp. CC120223-11 TaxID=1378073 RepID=UPI000BDA1541|nr:DUF2235 domain-containing protein [Enterobacter sp. CC120223-11]SNY79321.1 Uncharacterized alpha/beta hydrolase domain [Enterobacter sp. CC120223-11]
MSKIKPDLAWYPPEFPKQGRLPTDPLSIVQNCRLQDSHEINYRNELCKAAGKLVDSPCCKTLHISIFFDGTGNNLNNDLYLSKPAHPTNIARLFRATIGQGYAGGVQGHTEELVDVAGTSSNKYYKYYIPGVGTPFPEVSDLDYTTPGLAFATYGEERVNWGLLRIVDALRRTSGLSEISDAESHTAINSMTSNLGTDGPYKRKIVFNQLLNATDLAAAMKLAVTQPEPGKPKLLGIKLYVYGFSRGAASARAFVNWLTDLLPGARQKGSLIELCLLSDGVKIPLSIEFLGLLDTVASVGVANIAPFAEGHMGWADGTMELPDNGLIKKCTHLVSSHEQRLCFPMDSICRSDGTYPGYATEVVYPGMHSDLGGGYPPGDQGKASGVNDGNLLSQIALHDMYASAFDAGAPLKVSPQILSKELLSQLWRVMPPDLQLEFLISEALVERFNAWRELTLNLTSDKSDAPTDALQFNPIRASVNIITALENQMGWITAWRIGRYANGAYKSQKFYQDSALNGQNKDSDPVTLAASKAERAKKQKNVDDERIKLIVSRRYKEFIPLPPGPKDFDPAIAQVQLRQAAEEFNADYQSRPRPRTGSWKYQVVEPLSNVMYSFSENDFAEEYKRIKQSGEEKYAVLFQPHPNEDVTRSPAGLVRSLFDSQVHDSRAWFMQATFGEREPWGSYFLYRMIYFGELMSKNVPLIAKYGHFVDRQLKLALKNSLIMFDFTRGVGNTSDEGAANVKQIISVTPASKSLAEIINVNSNIQPAMTNTMTESFIQTCKAADEEKLAEAKADILRLW